MAKGKNLLFLIVVVAIMALAVGFLYWKNSQKETIAPNNYSDPEMPPLPPADADQQPEFPLTGPEEPTGAIVK